MVESHRIGFLEDGAQLLASHPSVSLDELKQRILKGIEEMNNHPVRFQWRAFDLELS